MSELAFDGSNPDVGVLLRINGMAAGAPHAVDRVAVFLGEYGLAAAVVGLVLWCWWRVARREPDAPAAVAGVLWAGAAGLLAWLLSLPVRELVQRPSPPGGTGGLSVLLHGTSRFSFVSGHATVAMAAAVALFLVHRRAGLVGIGLALAQGFARVWMGVCYPTDVIGGFALGTSTALLLGPLAMLGLVPLTRALAAGRLRTLVRSVAPLAPVPSAAPDGTGHDTARPGPSPLPACEKDLAA